MSGGLVPARAFFGADRLIEDLGGDLAAIAASTRFPLEAFQDPDLPVALSAGADFIEEAAKRCDRDDFGLLLAQRQDLTVLGPVYVMMSFAETIADALNMLVQYLKLHSAGLILAGTKVPDGMLLSYDIGADETAHDRQVVELGLGLLCNFIRIQLGQPWHPNYVQFRHSRPASILQHQKLFGPNVLFDQDHNAVCIDRGTLVAKTGRANQGAQTVMKRVIRNQEAFDAHGLEPRVAAAIRALLPCAGGCTIDVIANYLGMSIRTLQRSLARASTSFESIREKVRVDLAEKYLLQSTMPLAEIADVPGYSQPSAFTRVQAAP
jgi:AraC-like DNA-binding protein